MTAVLTKQMKIGLMGNCLPLHHPVRLGEELALLDNLSNGRLVVGMTRGGDFWAFNIASAESREALRRRLGDHPQRLGGRRAVRAPRQILESGLRGFLPRPLQKPIPETWIPSISAESMEWAAKNRICLAASWSPTEQVAEASNIIGAMQASTAAGNRVRNIAWFPAISMSARPML